MPDWKSGLSQAELQKLRNLMMDSAMYTTQPSFNINTKGTATEVAQQIIEQQLREITGYGGDCRKPELGKMQYALSLVTTNPLRFAQLECSFCHKDLRTNELDSAIVEVTGENNRLFLAHDICVAIIQRRIVDLDRNPVRNLTVKPTKLPETEEVEYTYFSLDWLQQMPNEFYNRFIRTIHENGGALQQDFETRSLIIVDDNMTDAGIAAIAEMLEGHGAQTRKVKVLKK